MGLSPKTGISNDAGLSPSAGVGTEGISGSGSAYVGPLDLVPGAVVAYSFRALSAAMLGQNVCRLRRDSDDAELNFTCDASTGLFPTATAVAWRDAAGATDAFVVTLFDQSGNGKDATQAIAASQPLWVSSLANGRPGFFCDGFTQGDDLLLTATSISIGAANTFMSVARVGTAFGAASMFGNNSGSGSDWFEFSLSPDGASLQATTLKNGGNQIAAIGDTDISATLATYFYANAALADGAGNQIIRVNGAVIQVSGIEGPGAAFTTRLAVCDSDETGAAPFDGDIMEIITYASALSLANKQLIEQDQAAFYTI